MQVFLNNETCTQLEIISNLFILIYNLIWIIIIIIAITGVVFWFINKDYRSKYQLEKPSQLEFIAELFINGIEGGIFGIKNLFNLLFLQLFLFIVLLIIFGPIVYYILGFKGLLVILFLESIIILKIDIFLLEKLTEEGKNNNNIITASIVINSIEKVVISSQDLVIISKKNFLFLVISLILFIKIELFYFWAFLWVIYFVYKFLSLIYQIRLMTKLPLFVNVEYLTGETEKNLLLYQSTAIDYRFSQKNGVNNLIIPATSIKNIQFSYDVLLNRIDDQLNFKPPKFDKLKIPSFFKNYLNKFSQSIFESKLRNKKPELWYKKAVIYSKISDFENAEKCIKEAIKLGKNIRDIAIDDINLANIINEKWFVDLLEEDEKSE